MKRKNSNSLKCLPPNAQCGGRCLEPDKQCRVNSPEVKSAIDRLLETKPKQLLKAAKAKGFGPVQYITHQDALRAYGVYGGADIFSMKRGEASHPYLKIGKIEQSAVDAVFNKLKADKEAAVKSAKEQGKKAPFTLYDRLANAGIRGDNPKVSTEERVKIFIRLYMEQNGQSFATGNRVNLNRLVVDHVIPLTAGGKNTVDNMVLIENNINYWKKAIPTQEKMAEALERKIALPVSPDLLKNYAKSLAAGDKRESDRLQAQIQNINKTVARDQDRLQARAFREGAKQKGAIAGSYEGLKWAKFNTIEALDNLSPKETKQLLKVQSKEAGTVRGWLRNRASQSSVELGSTNVQKAQIFLTNGGKWKDLPESWKEDFKERYLNNQHPKGNQAIKDQFGSLEGSPDWLN
jgi:hypothetical protein